jgi:hypothetical protein
MVERHHGLDSRFQEAVDQLVVVVEAGRVDLIAAGGKDARPGHREAIGADAEPLHELDVARPQMIVVAGHRAVAAVGDGARLHGEAIPDRLAAAVAMAGAFDLVGRRSGSPKEAVREARHDRRLLRLSTGGSARRGRRQERAARAKGAGSGPKREDSAGERTAGRRRCGFGGRGFGQRRLGRFAADGTFAGARRGRQQQARVGMRRRRQHRRRRTGLDEPAGIEDEHAIGDRCRRRQIVRDEEDGDLRLHATSSAVVGSSAMISCGSPASASAIERQRQRHHALAHAARELVRILRQPRASGAGRPVWRSSSIARSRACAALSGRCVRSVSISWRPIV